jgi:hypothetical protein
MILRPIWTYICLINRILGFFHENHQLYQTIRQITISGTFFSPKSHRPLLDKGA